MSVEEVITSITNVVPNMMDAFGRLFPGIPHRSLDKAELKATQRMLDDIEKATARCEEMGLSREFQASVIADITKRHTRSERFESVLCFAAGMNPDTSRVDDIEQDWIEDFQEHAEKACDEDMQRTWGAVLAGEMDAPGSFSKRTMDILSKMSKAEAESFRRLCGCATYLYVPGSEKGRSPEPVPVLEIDDDYASYNGGQITAREIGILDSIGLIDSGRMTPLKIEPGFGYPFYTSDGIVLVRAKDDAGKVAVDFKSAIFTPSGTELASVCGIGGDPRLRQVLIDKFSSAGLVVADFIDMSHDQT